VIGTFVLDLGQSAGKSAPSASLTVSTDTTTESIEVQHKGGDTLQSENTKVIVTNESTGNTVTFEGANVSTTLSVGGKANASFANSRLDFDNSGSPEKADYPVPGSPSFTGLEDGVQYSVQLIDTESQRVIFETTVTA
jgi:FlaG/FlaF family flagellin (archaellin)